MTEYDKELQDIINNFYDGKLDKPKRKENKKSLIEVNNNCKSFPDKGHVCLPSTDVPFTLQERIF